MTVSAHDVDEGANAEVTYELDSDMFLIHAVSGEISTSKQPLDREDAGEYRVMVTAKDKGTPTPRSGEKLFRSHSMRISEKMR